MDMIYYNNISDSDWLYKLFIIFIFATLKR